MGREPYATIDNCVSMTAQTPATSDASGVQYYFHCTAGGGPDSAWQDSPTYKTTALADGTYSYQYKVRDKSAQLNASGYSSTYSATITPTTGYHTCTFAQVASLPDDNLVTFNGVVLQANSDNYLVKDTATNTTALVRTAASGQATDPTNVLKIVTVKGHLWTYSGVRQVTYSTVTPIFGAPTFAVTGRVTGTGGAGVPSATVYFSATANASVNPTCTTTTDANGYYTMPLCNGLWYACVTAANYFPTSDQTVTVNGSPVANFNITITGMLHDHGIRRQRRNHRSVRRRAGGQWWQPSVHDHEE